MLQVVRRAVGVVCLAVLAAGASGGCATPPTGPPPLAPMVTTTPKPIEAGLVHFTAAGDYSSSTEARNVLAGIASARPNLHFALGDFSYDREGTESEWCDLVTSYVGADFPFQLIAGNHESDGQNGHIDAFAKCLPNRLPGLSGEYGRQYYVDVPADDPLVRFIMISPGLRFDDGDWNYDRGTKRYQWTESAIDEARAAEIPWTVVGMHKPCLTIGRYSCDPGEDVLNLLLSERVDLVLNGHEHLYQRTKQLAISRTCRAVSWSQADNACIADSDATLEHGDGTVIVTIGTGGNDLRDVMPTKEKAPYFAAWSGLNASPTFGFLDVAVSESRITAKFIRAGAGEFVDEFVIEANSGG